MFAVPWYYLIAISAVFNAGTLILEKRLLRVEHALAFSASVAFSISLLSLFFIPFVTFSLTLFDLALILAYSIMLAVGYWVSARLFRHGSLSTGSPIYNIMPNIIVVFLGFVLLGEELTPTQYIAIAVMLATAFFMAFESNKKRDVEGKSKYNYTIVISAIIVGTTLVLLKYALGFMSPITFIFFTNIFTPFIVWLMIFRRPAPYRKEAGMDIRKYIKLLVALAALTLTYRLLLYTAIVSSQISVAGPFNSALIVIITVLSGGIFFGEHHIPRKVALSMIMLIASYFLLV